MNYKDFEATVEFDEDAEIFHGEVVNVRDIITFQGSSVEELKQAFEDSVEDYLEFCRERGEQPDQPFSGELVVQISPELHRQLHRKAQSSGKSLDLFVKESLMAVWVIKIL
ncbi:MAG: type II toxin-antitoxin system HicB family antitoxin [Acidobacteriota bacterium]|nr:type II toxin-antitoxin system HicB family antitoxin [Acidobacteriota bacterium]